MTANLQTKRCLTCQGSKKIMGGGMIFKDCPDCEGQGKLYVVNDEIKYLQEIAEKNKQNTVDDIQKNIETTEQQSQASQTFAKRRGRPRVNI